MFRVGARDQKTPVYFQVLALRCNCSWRVSTLDNLFFFAVKLAELRTSACTNGIAAVRTIYDTKD